MALLPIISKLNRLKYRQQIIFIENNSLKPDIADSFHCLFQMIEDCIYIHDMEGRFIAVNKAVERTYDKPASYFIGKTPEDFAAPGCNDLSHIKSLWQKCVSGKPQRFEFWGINGKGEDFPKEVIINQGVYSEEKVIIAVARDISKQKSIEAKLRKYAESDSLTGLFNRRVFFEMSQQAISYCNRYKQNLSAVLIDIDHFKKINDSYGHPVGDKVLLEFGHMLSNNARASDIVARIGGEEFAIIMPNTTQEQALQWTMSFNQVLSSFSICIEAVNLSVTASIGIATLGEKAGDCESLIQAADNALYAAKRAGRDCVKIA